jgi:hypothetical protein
LVFWTLLCVANTFDEDIKNIKHHLLTMLGLITMTPEFRTGASVAGTSKVCAPAKLLLLIVEN